MRAIRLIAFSALLIVPLTSCGDATAPEAGRLSLLLTDAPGDVRSAVVTITQVYLQREDEEESSAEEGENAPAEAGRLVLREEDVTVDLLTLQDQLMSLVEDVEVPGGRWGQLRLVISGGYIEVEQEDGSLRLYASAPGYEGIPAEKQVHGALIMPSYATSGLKVNLPDGQLFVDGDERTLVVDFVVAESFGQQAGLSGNWVMHPVINATTAPNGTTATVEP